MYTCGISVRLKKATSVIPDPDPVNPGYNLKH